MNQKNQCQIAYVMYPRGYRRTNAFARDCHLDALAANEKFRGDRH